MSVIEMFRQQFDSFRLAGLSSRDSQAVTQVILFELSYLDSHIRSLYFRQDGSSYRSV